MTLFFCITAAVFSIWAYWNSRVLRRTLLGSDYRTKSEVLLHSAFVTVIPPVLIVLVFVLNGQSDSLPEFVINFMLLLKGTIHPVPLGIYQGTSVGLIGDTIRLVVFSLGFSVIMAWVIFALRTLVRGKFLSASTEIFFALLESVPDSVYIMLSVFIMVALVETYTIALPMFYDGAPRFVDTWIPAFVLAIPSALSLQRVMYLRFNEESQAQYIQTARSKGASSGRVFVLHVVPNVVPAFIGSLRAASIMILSSVLFVEFFMGYNGQLSQFIPGVGEGVSDGLPTVVISGGSVVFDSSGHPEYYYYSGTLVVIGLLLVGLWMLFENGLRALRGWLFPAEVEQAVAPYARKKFGWGWVAIGSGLILTVLVLGAFPSLLTHYTPNYRDLTSSATLSAMPPYQPSSRHPLGTDALGRDLLSRTLYAIFPSLIPAVMITLVTVLLSLALCIVIVDNPTGRASRFAGIISQWLSSVPVLFIAFLALYPENRVVEQMYGHASPNHVVQAFWFIIWISVLETGRFSFELRNHITDWYRLVFVESAVALGRGRIVILFTHLRSWLGRYLLEFGLTEFSRVVSLMTQLGAMHIYLQSQIGLLPFDSSNILANAGQWPVGLVSAHPTWFGMIGSSTLTLSYISYPFYIEGPLIALLLVMVGVNLMAHGIRGTARR